MKYPLAQRVNTRYLAYGPYSTSPDQYQYPHCVLTILVVRISIRINFVRIQVRIESLSERFYPHADDIRTTFSKISR